MLCDPAFEFSLGFEICHKLVTIMQGNMPSLDFFIKEILYILNNILYFCVDIQIS